MAETKTSPKRTSKPRVLILIAAVLVSAAAVFLYAGWLGYQEAPKRIELAESQPGQADPVLMSAPQQEILREYGDPESFTILFYEEDIPQGEIQTVRLETWEYYGAGVGFTFINGELVSESPLELADPGPLTPLPYRPDQFSAFMSLDDLTAELGLTSYLEIPLNENFMERGTLYYADSLSFGLQDNQLIYLEALALVEE